MHTQIGKTLSIGLLLYIYLPSSLAQSVSLSEFQQISGFSPACTAVYNSFIPGCTFSDFQPTNQCSSTCIQGLEQITKELGNACAGTRVDTSTLIGLFFANKGISAVCPNGQQTSPSYTVGPGTTTAASTLSAVSTTIPLPQTTTTAQRVVTSSSTQQSTASAQIQSSTLIVSSPSTTVSTAPVSSAAPTTFSPNPNTQSTFVTTTSSASPSHNPDAILKTAINDGSAEVITSKAQQTASKNPDAFGGGGSPFEIAIPSNAGFGLDRRWIWLGILSSLGLLWL